MYLSIAGYLIREKVTGQIIIALLILILVFLVSRELSCWYWKINERNNLLIEIRNLLEMLNDKTDESIDIVKRNKTTRTYENYSKDEKQGTVKETHTQN